MTRTTAFATALAVVCLVPAAASAGGPADVYYERALMSAANARCNLFDAGTASALAAGAAQARGAALRAGVRPSDLQAIRARAQAKAVAVSCASPDLRTAATRVRVGFEGYGKLIRMIYPGDVAGWRADRTSRKDAPTWRLSQTAAYAPSPVTFGLAGPRGGAGSLIAVTRFPAGGQPYSARLIIRDATRTSGPYLGVARLGASASIPLTSRVAPRTASRVFVAEARGGAEPSLSPAGVSDATAFRFPRAAVDAMADLDPREAVIVEFAFAGRSGDVVRQAYVEVGDFAAGQAFLTGAR